MGDEGKFWLVWSPVGYQSPRYKHSTRESAENEARRLASQNGGEYYVLEALGKAQRIQATYEALA